jgi:hypothetical protein
MKLAAVDYVYVLLSCIAGLWQSWCVNYARDNILAVILVILMSLPFTLASYGYALFLHRTSMAAEQPNWSRILVLWAGMPLSMVVGSLALLAQTAIMYVVGFGIVDLPFYSLRLLIGEGAACLVWAECLVIWSRQRSLRSARTRFLATFTALCVGLLIAYGLSTVMLIKFHKNVFWSSTSIVMTAISALVVVHLKRDSQEAFT